MEVTTIALRVVNVKNKVIVFEDSRKVTETKELVSSEKRGDAYFGEIQSMIQAFKQSPNYDPPKKKLFGKTIKYDYWMKMDSTGEPLPETPRSERTKFEEFIRKHTEPPEGWPWVNLRMTGWADLD